MSRNSSLESQAFVMRASTGNRLLYIELNITKEKVCSGQAFELATTTERLRVGEGYTVLQKTRHGILAKLIILKRKGIYE